MCYRIALVRYYRRVLAGLRQMRCGALSESARRARPADVDNGRQLRRAHFMQRQLGTNRRHPPVVAVRVVRRLDDLVPFNARQEKALPRPMCPHVVEPFIDLIPDRGYATKLSGGHLPPDGGRPAVGRCGWPQRRWSVRSRAPWRAPPRPGCGPTRRRAGRSWPGNSSTAASTMPSPGVVSRIGLLETQDHFPH